MIGDYLNMGNRKESLANESFAQASAACKQIYESIFPLSHNSPFYQFTVSYSTLRNIQYLFGSSPRFFVAYNLYHLIISIL